MDTSQDLLQEKTLVIINFTFFILFFFLYFYTLLALVNSFDPTITIPYLFK